MSPVAVALAAVVIVGLGVVVLLAEAWDRIAAAVGGLG